MIETTYLDEGPPGWEAGPHDLTCVQEGTLPTDQVLQYPGNNHEERLFYERDCGRYTPRAWKAFKQSISEKGILENILVFVDKHGITVGEGNHRLRAAQQLGIAEVPVEVRYFGNLQREIDIGLHRGR